MPTLATQRIVRTFNFNGVMLDDPLPAGTVEQVRQIHAALYSAIGNAKIEGPDYQGDRAVWTYKTQVGTKG